MFQINRPTLHVLPRYQIGMWQYHKKNTLTSIYCIFQYREIVSGFFVYFIAPPSVWDKNNLCQRGTHYFSALNFIPLTRCVSELSFSEIQAPNFAQTHFLLTDCFQNFIQKYGFHKNRNKQNFPFLARWVLEVSCSQKRTRWLKEKLQVYIYLDVNFWQYYQCNFHQSFS